MSDEKDRILVAIKPELGYLVVRKAGDTGLVQPVALFHGERAENNAKDHLAIVLEGRESLKKLLHIKWEYAIALVSMPPPEAWH